MNEKKPWSFCVDPEQKCTLNYCDENGCHERDRVLVEPKETIEELDAPENLEYRMYGLVPYNLSPIQQGIQFGHAVQEFNNKMIKYLHDGDEYSTFFHRSYLEFDKWRLHDKTFIVLNGGTTNNRMQSIDLSPVGSLNNHLKTLLDNGVMLASFEEPDLGDQLTAVVLLADERVWNTKKYPNKREDMSDDLAFYPGETDKYYENRLGGPTNVFLRQFLKQFKLA